MAWNPGSRSYVTLAAELNRPQALNAVCEKKHTELSVNKLVRYA